MRRPPQPPAPVAWPRAYPVPRRRRWYRRKRVLFPLGLLIAIVVLSSAADERPPVDLPPGTARDGILEFTVTDVSCGNRSLGTGITTRRAQGQLCTVALHVRNFGDDTRRVHVGSQKLHDRAGRTFSADSGAWTYLSSSAPFFQQELNPGNELDGVLVYDIATDAVPTSLEVHDSPLSGGTTLTL